MLGFIQDYYAIKVKGEKPNWIKSEWGRNQMQEYWEEQRQIEEKRVKALSNSMPYGQWINLCDYTPISEDYLRIRYAGRDWVSGITRTNFRASLHDSTVHFSVSWGMFGELNLSSNVHGKVMRFKTYEEAVKSFETIPDSTTAEMKEILEKQNIEGWKAVTGRL